MISRRTFLKTAAVGTAAMAFESIEGPVKAFAASTKDSPIIGANGKVNLALIGIGNRGADDANGLYATGLANIVALCDVDMGAKHTLKIMNKFPNVPKYKDFRKMFDEMADKIDAVMVATPDFSHFPICMRAIKEGKHVYCEKPLTHTFYESEMLIQAAKAHPDVVTQMGNQGHSAANYYQFKAWTEAGIIKNVTAITAHMNSARRWHPYDPAITKFPDPEPIPETLDWDAWHVGRMYHDYTEKFHYGNWRSWYDFGMGALGDWGAHILDSAHQFLDLGLPSEVEILRKDGYNNYFFPMSSTIRFHFPRRGDKPACDVTWYDGLDNLPPLPKGYGEDKGNSMVPTVDGVEAKKSLSPGKIIYSDDLIFRGGTHEATLNIIPEEAAKDMANKLPEVPQAPNNHYENFLLACLGKCKTTSPFEISGPLSQVFNLGVVAQRLGRGFKFDRNTKEVLNDPFANALLVEAAPRKGWEDYYKL